MECFLNEFVVFREKKFSYRRDSYKIIHFLLCLAYKNPCIHTGRPRKKEQPFLENLIKALQHLFIKTYFFWF